MRIAPSLELTLGVLAVSTGAVLVRSCTVPSLGIASWRLLLAAVGFLALCAWRRRPALAAFHGRDRTTAVLSGVFLAAHFAAWITSLSMTSVASSVVLVTTAPLWVGLGSRILLREDPGRTFWQGLALALAGTALVTLVDQSPTGQAPAPMLGNALALLGALAASAYLLAGRKLQRKADTLSYVAVVYGVAALVLVGMAWLWGTPLTGYEGRDWLLLGLLALVPQGIGHTLLNRSLRVFQAGIVATALLGEPVAASALAWLVLGEPVGPWQILGGGLILIGVARASARSADAAPVGRSPQDTGEGSLNQQEGPSLEEPERQKPGFIHRSAGWCSMRMVRIPWLLRLMTRLHVLVYQATGGRIGGRMAGTPMLLLHHMGRKSGRAFVAPLLCLEEAGDLVVVASYGGSPVDPAWWTNLQAAGGRGLVQFGRRVQQVQAEIVPSPRRETLWNRFVQAWPAYEDYRRATSRRIPIVVLKPLRASAPRQSFAEMDRSPMKSPPASNPKDQTCFNGATPG